MQTTVGPHELALVSPQDFSVRMRKHWSETLNMPTPPALIDVHRLMAEEFRRIIINNATDHDSGASVALPCLQVAEKRKAHASMLPCKLTSTLIPQRTASLWAS
jgi:hypothetical protein